MALDPNIILAGKPAPSPLQSISDVLQVQGQIRQSQQQEQALQAQRALDQSMQQAINPDGSFNRDVLRQGVISKGFGHVWPQIDKQLTEADKARADLADTQAKTDALKLDYGGALAASVKAMNYDPGAFLGALNMARAHGVLSDPAYQAAIQAVQQDPSNIQKITDSMLAQSPKQSELANAKMTAEARKAQADTGAQRLAAELPGMQAKAAVEQQVAAGTQGGITPEQQVQLAMRQTAQQETARHNRIEESQGAARVGIARQRLAQGGAVGAGAGDKVQNAKDIAAAIISGDQPPDLARLYGLGGLVRAELARNGYNLTRASEDWTATQKYLSTLNGQQQTRLRQAVSFTQESIPQIRDLVKQWDAGQFPLLNKASLALAKNGAFGQQASSIATRLDAQIADLNSELGTVYKGGNSSTDESLRLASENLKSNWSRKVALDALDQIEKNLQIRQNSMRNVQPVANPGNPYAPPQQPAAAPQGGSVSVTAPNGKTYTFKSQADADAFRAKAGIK